MSLLLYRPRSSVSAYTVTHVGPNFQLAGGVHLKSAGRKVTHVGPNFQLAGGTHRKTARRSHTAPNFALVGGTHTPVSSGVANPIDITEIDVDYLVTVSVGGSLDTVALVGDYLSPVLPIPGDYATSVVGAGSYSTSIAIAGSYDTVIAGGGTP